MKVTGGWRSAVYPLTWAQMLDEHRAGELALLGTHHAGPAQPAVHQPAQVDPLRQHRSRQQTRVRHQIRFVEGRATRLIEGCSHQQMPLHVLDSDP